MARRKPHEMRRETKVCARCAHVGWEWAPVIVAAYSTDGVRYLCARTDMCQARRRELLDEADRWLATRSGARGLSGAGAWR